MWFLFLLAIGFLDSLLDAYVLSRLWAWFVVPQFHATTMPMAVAFGCLSALSILRKQYVLKVAHEQEAGKEAAAIQIVQSLVLTLLAWSWGAVAHFYF
ncbi:MAG: hypothetical protein V4550_18235 [Gemmatimonadota bacterium]